MMSGALRRHVIAPSNPAPIDARWRSRVAAVYGLDWGVDGESDGSSYWARSTPLLRNALGTPGGMHGFYTTDVPTTHTLNEFGRALYYDGSHNTYTKGLAGRDNGAARDESCVVVFSPASSAGSQAIFGYANVWDTSLADYGRGVGIEGGQLFVWGASAKNNKKWSGTLPALGSVNVLAVRFALNGAVYLNGVELVTNVDLSHSWGYYLAAGSAIGAVEGGGVAKFTGSLGPRTWLYDGLTNAELAELSTEPLRLFAPRRRPYFVASAATAPTGTLDKTLAALTLTAAAEVANGPGATISGTLAALTLGASAEIANGPAATLAGTLGALTLSSESAVGSGPAATLAGTLAALTLSSGASVANGPAATLAATLGALTLTAEATSNTGPTAAVAGTLGALTLTASAEAVNGPAATLAGTLAALSVSAAAEITDYVAPADTTATLAGTFAALTLVSAASVAGADAALPRTRRISPATLSLVGGPSTSRLRAARRIGNSTLRRAA